MPNPSNKTISQKKTPKRILSFKQFLALKYPKKASSSSVGNAEVSSLPDLDHKHHPMNRSIISGGSTLLDLNRT